jgi:hypothetical protein
MRRILASSVIAVSLVLVIGVVAQSPPPVIVTDKSGYLTGQTVLVSGSGFAANEAVSLQLAQVGGAAAAPISVSATRAAF